MKKWSISIIAVLGCIVIAIGALVVIVDPYFHYHKPIAGLSYQLGNEAYRNDGVSKHFEYDSMITGTSMTRSFRVSEAEKLFGGEFVRITFQGEGMKRINDNLKMAIEANDDLKFVIRSVDPIWFVTDVDWMGYDEYPDYLYDDNLWNDVQYLYNMEILMEDVIPELVRTIRQVPAENYDDLVGDDDSLAGREAVLREYDRPEKTEKKIDAEETEEYFDMLDRNIEQNVVSIIRDNPDITFYIFFPPYSICWWDSLMQNGADVLQRRIWMEEYVIQKLLDYDNVRLFSFSNNFELVCDLNYYIDDVHYTDKASSKILAWMKEGKFEVTKSNYMDYIEEITDFYLNFDYDSVFSDK